MSLNKLDQMTDNELANYCNEKSKQGGSKEEYLEALQVVTSRFEFVVKNNRALLQIINKDRK